MNRLPQRAALAASLALVFGVTLRPVGGSNRLALAPWAAQQLNAVNVVGNVALFALPSAVLGAYGWSLRRTVAAGFVLSLGIELLQLAVPGRTTATTDVLCNTLGAAAGWLLARESRRFGRVHTTNSGRLPVTRAQRSAQLSVMLIVPDADAAISWYEDALGATKLWDLGGVAGLQINGAPFFLHETNPDNPNEQSPDRIGATSTRIELFVDDPDAVLERAIAAGATPGSAIEDHEHTWGTHRQGGFRDPFGHNWSVGDRSPLGPHQPARPSAATADAGHDAWRRGLSA